MMTNKTASPSPSAPLPLFLWWRRWDRALFAAETAIVTTFSIAMVLVVFIAVFHQRFAEPNPVPVRWAQSLWPECPPFIALSITGLIWWSLLWGAFLKGSRTMSRPMIFTSATGVWLVSVGLGMGLPLLFPTGIPGYQKIAMGLFVWVMLLGASMAVHRRSHLSIAATQKLVAARYKPQQATLGLALAALLCGVLATVSLEYTWARFTIWRVSEGFSGDDWIVVLAIPIGFGLMALRFLMQSFFVLTRSIPAYPTDQESDTQSGRT